MYKHLTSACALIALMTLLSCSETSNPTKPDDSGNNNNIKTKRVVYHSVKGEKDTNAVVWISDIDGGNKRELMRGYVVFNSFIHNEKVIIVDQNYNNEKQMRFTTLHLYDLKTNTKEIIQQQPVKNGDVITRIRPETALTPDGKKMCFILDSIGITDSKILFKRHKLYVLDFSTKTTKFLADDVASEQKISVSPDGKYIAYYGGWYDNESPTDRLYVVSLDGAVKKQITGDVGYLGDSYSTREWSNDNQYLITNARGQEKFLLVNRNTWQVEKTLEFPDLGDKGEMIFSKDNSTIYFTSEKGKYNTPDFSYDIYSYVLSTGELRRIVGSKVSGAKLSPRMSNDGTTLLFSSVPLSGSDIDYFLFRNLHTINLKDSTITTLPDKSTMYYQLVE